MNELHYAATSTDIILQQMNKTHRISGEHGRLTTQIKHYAAKNVEENDRGC